jgi:hypothetical protein
MMSKLARQFIYKKKFLIRKISDLFFHIHPFVIIRRAGKNSSVHRSTQRMSNRISKTLQVKIAYYMQNLGTFFTFTFSKTFTIAEHWALIQMATLLTFRWQHYRAE